MLTATGLVRRYPKVIAVDGVDLNIDEGEIVALLGPNGAGKTTTLRMLIGMQRPDQGVIRYRTRDGQETDRVPGSELGYLPEERGLYLDQPVLRVLVYFAELRGVPRQAARTTAQAWLERLELGDRAQDLVKSLSKGNQQKVQFIASILHEPRLAIIDEPFSGFDPINQERMVDLVASLRARGTTVLLSAHQMDLVERLADRIVLLHRGKVVLSGDLASLRATSGLATGMEVEFEAPVGDTGSAPDEKWADDRRTVRVATGEGALNERLERLSALGPIRGIRSVQPRLHDLYLHAVNAREGPV